MGRRLVPATMVAAALALMVAATTATMVPYRPTWWKGAVALAILGGIAPMIYAINIRIVPVFSTRKWRSEPALRAQVVLAVAGAWGIFAGELGRSDALVRLGSFSAFLGGLLFMVNIMRLFRQPAGATPPLPLPYPHQARVDKYATHFTRLSGLYLVVGLAIGVLLSWWTPASGRWELVWAHTLLVGFFLSMAAGVCYHVFARWTNKRWRWLGGIRLHLMLVTLGLPLMLAALATNDTSLFALAGPVQAAALALFLFNVAPMVTGLPLLTRVALIAAGALLLVGIGLGATFAIDPALGARLRLTHATLNLFGWTGLLISGMGYYLAPRFLGRPLRWRWLAWLQIVCLTVGALGGAGALARWTTDGSMRPLVVIALALVALSFACFGAIVAGTALTRISAGGTVGLVQMPAGPRIRLHKRAS
ncbi:MAG TPA: hypothetical protein VFL82_07520 [Thermomicrobiales bacterium]|nr:hypothetical protein [Thermomicrobiales bacterium]